jgi:adenine/guanine phosphoribosyltransferase-like PRPP-binding protein
MMRTLKAFRNVLGTAGLIFAGYVFLVSLKDSWRYIKISRM